MRERKFGLVLTCSLWCVDGKANLLSIWADKDIDVILSRRDGSDYAYSVCADLRSPLAPVTPPTDLSICWTLKSLKNDKIHKIHTPKIQGRVFFEGAEAPQAAAPQPQRAGGTLKPAKQNICWVNTSQEIVNKCDVGFWQNNSDLPNINMLKYAEEHVPHVPKSRSRKVQKIQVCSLTLIG